MEAGVARRGGLDDDGDRLDPDETSHLTEDTADGAGAGFWP
jgi:hypothetical protein